MKCANCGKDVFSKETCSCGVKAPTFRKAAVCANSVVCIVILVLAIISLIFTISFRHIINNDLLVETVKEADLAQIEITDNGEKVKLDKYVYDKYIDDERITIANVDNILNHSFIKDFIIEKIHGYQDYLMGEGDMVYIRSDDIVELIDKNSALLYNEAGLNFLEPDKDELKKNLSGLDKFSDMCEKDLSGWFASGYIRSYFSIYLVIFLIVLIAAVLAQWLLVYKFNERRMLKALRTYGITFTSASGGMFILSTIPLIASTSLSPALSLSRLIVPFFVCSAVLFGIGILTLVGSIIAIRIISDKEMAQAALEGNASGAAFDGGVPQEENTVLPESGAMQAGTFGAVNGVNGTEFAQSADGQNGTDTEANAEAAAPENSGIGIPVFSAESIWSEAANKSQPSGEQPKENDTTDSAKTSDIPKPSAVNASFAPPKQEKAAAADENIEKPKKQFVFCTKCGHKNKYGSSFCAQCGNKLRK